MQNLSKRIILYFVFSILLTSQSLFAQRETNINEYKLFSTYKMILSKYVDTVNQSKYVEKVIEAMLKELDPHCSYISKEELKEVNEPLVGNFDGVGMQFSIVNDTIVCVSPIAGGPSEKLGVKIGDKIVFINDSIATGKKITNSFVFKKLRGPKGTKVKVTMLRKGIKELLEFNITRDKIPMNSIDARYMIDNKTGYIKLDRFAQNSIYEFDTSIISLKIKGMKNLILDLRGNSGGYLNVAIELAEEFLEDNKLVVFTEGVNSPTQKYFSSERGYFKKGKLIVLIDEGSASASEIVSGAVQDWDRGLLIGRRTFGKGLVQGQFNLPDGSMVRLTTARYHTPTGRCIQKPYKEGTEEYIKDLNNRYKKGEWFHADSIKFPDSLKYYTPSRRVVYGGGGIMPDIFVPLDTSMVSEYLTNIARKGLTNQYVLNYIDNVNPRADILVKYKHVDNFISDFKITNDMFKDFVKFCEKNGVKEDKKGIEASEEFISTQIKGLIARYVWDFNALYRIVNPLDESYRKALEVIKDDKMFNKYKIKY